MAYDPALASTDGGNKDAGLRTRSWAGGTVPPAPPLQRTYP